MGSDEQEQRIQASYENESKSGIAAMVENKMRTDVKG
jgi:hypothetical protein